MVVQSDHPSSPGEWMSTIETRSLDTGVWVLPQARWPLCEVEVDTTGLPQSATAWNLLMEQVSDGLTLRSFFNVLSGQSMDSLVTIEEVPVRAEVLLVRVTDTGDGDGGTSSGGPMGITLGSGGKSLVFESDAGTTDTPRIESTDDLSAGAWRSVGAAWTRQGSKWRWEMPVDSTAGSRFYRLAP